MGFCAPNCLTRKKKKEAYSKDEKLYSVRGGQIKLFPVIFKGVQLGDQTATKN